MVYDDIFYISSLCQLIYKQSDTSLTYPDFNETFKIHTNDSAFQLGAVISQKGKPITFYSIKLTDSQRWYTVTERELISVVETLK